VWKTKTRRWVVRDADRFSRYADEVVIELVVVVEVFVNSDSIYARREIAMMRRFLAFEGMGRNP
jgi:hypothetical protein